MSHKEINTFKVGDIVILRTNIEMQRHYTSHYDYTLDIECKRKGFPAVLKIVRIDDTTIYFKGSDRPCHFGWFKKKEIDYTEFDKHCEKLKAVENKND
jgi:hypothetical protein